MALNAYTTTTLDTYTYETSGVSYIKYPIKYPNFGIPTDYQITFSSPFANNTMRKEIVFTKDKPFGVYHNGFINGPYTEDEAHEKADDWASQERATVFVVKVLATVKPERKTVRTPW